MFPWRGRQVSDALYALGFVASEDVVESVVMQSRFAPYVDLPTVSCRSPAFRPAPRSPPPPRLAPPQFIRVVLTHGHAFDKVGEDVEELFREFSEDGSCRVRASDLVHLLQGVDMEGSMSGEEAREFCRLVGIDPTAGGEDQLVDYGALVQDMVFSGRPTPA